MTNSASEQPVNSDQGGKGRFANVNGLKMYYEIHGAGRPLVLLHGNLSAIGTSFGKVLPDLAKTHQVIGVEQQAHGHTADIDRPLSLEQMAADTAALLRELGIENADCFGYSTGGGVAMQIALRYPELVRKLVLMGGISYRPEGLHPEVLSGIDAIKAEDMIGSPWQEEYARIAPHPDDWPRLVAKIQALNRAFKGWSEEDIRSLKAPVLLIVGDADIVQPEHAVQLFRLLGGGVAGDLAGLPESRLAILPGTTHVSIVDRADWLISMIEEFLE